MKKLNVSAALAAPLMALSFATAAPADAAVDMSKRFTMEINNPHTGRPVSVPVMCSTLNPAAPNDITYAFADQFHRALSNGGNMGDFKAPTNTKSSANPLFEHMYKAHGYGPFYYKILRGRPSQSDVQAYAADPVGDNPALGAHLWCKGDSSRLAPTFKLDDAGDIVLDR
ncbi:MAG: hypothetical protein LRZ85_04605 [Alphaproteobacteria bacterium]|nr:hypothetical protein [Alphaproteobacteria bacterium]MCD8519984.1 hypothetical protein [Alphaproteobacteria bacterium]MCD8571455.1 hypothetical protein [Alphaproteobacteria bacterium]